MTTQNAYQPTYTATSYSGLIRLIVAIIAIVVIGWLLLKWTDKPAVVEPAKTEALEPVIAETMALSGTWQDCKIQSDTGRVYLGRDALYAPSVKTDCVAVDASQFSVAPIYKLISLDSGPTAYFCKHKPAELADLGLCEKD